MLLELFVLIFFCFVLYLIYASTKGMCRWVEHDSPPMFFLKWLVNTLLGGIPGIFMFIKYPNDCRVKQGQTSTSGTKLP